MKSNHLIAAIIFCLYSAIGHSSEQFSVGNAEICQSLLGNAEANALASATETGGYNFQILTKNIDGTLRTVLLLGESHWKNQSEGSAGKMLVEQFRYIGVEAARIDGLWGGKFLSWLLRSVNRTMQERGDVGSTIDSAMSAEGKEKVKMALATVFLEAGIEIDKVKDFSDLPLRDGARISAAEIMDLMRALKADEAQNSTKQTFDLEKGHKITLRENLGSILLPIQLMGPVAACGVSACYLAYAALAAPDHLNPAVVLAGISLSSVVALKRIKSNWLLGKLLGDPRNPTMAENILKVLSENSKVDKLLVIVGAEHVVGIGDLLKRQGFSLTVASSFRPQ